MINSWLNIVAEVLNEKKEYLSISEIFQECIYYCLQVTFKYHF